VDNWDVVGGDWNTASQSEGVFTFEATYRFPGGSSNLFDVDRNVTTVTIGVTVSTIDYLDNLDEVSFSKNASDTESTLTLSFNVDDADPTRILGSQIDTINAANGVAELSLAAPASATTAEISLNSGTAEVVNVASNAVTFSVPVASGSGSDWNLVQDGLTYDVLITYKEGSDILYTQVMEITVVHNSTDFIDVLNAASTGSAIESLLSSASQSAISSAFNADSTRITAFYNTLKDNLDETPLTSYASFETLISDLLAYEAALDASVSYANTVDGSEALSDSNYETLLGDIVTTLSGTSIQVINKSSASILASSFAQLESDLKDISQPIWVAEDIASDKPFNDFLDLETTLRQIVSDLSGKVIYDPSL